MEKLLYRVEEAAGILGLSRAKVYQYIAKGELRIRKYGGATRIHADDIQAFARRDTVDQQTAAREVVLA